MPELVWRSPRWAVMCCGCYRFLGQGGLVVDSSGMVDLSTVVFFETQEDADATAAAEGWQIRNKQGESDHRCPECRDGKPSHICPPPGYVRSLQSRPGEGSFVPAHMLPGADAEEGSKS